MQVTGADRAILTKRLDLVQEIIKYMCRLDPGQTKKMGVFLLEYNKPKLKLAKLDMNEGRITKLQFLKVRLISSLMMN